MTTPSIYWIWIPDCTFLLLTELSLHLKHTNYRRKKPAGTPNIWKSPFSQMSTGDASYWPPNKRGIIINLRSLLHRWRDSSVACSSDRTLSIFSCSLKGPSVHPSSVYQVAASIASARGPSLHLTHLWRRYVGKLMAREPFRKLDFSSDVFLFASACSICFTSALPATERPLAFLLQGAWNWPLCLVSALLWNFTFVLNYLWYD